MTALLDRDKLGKVLARLESDHDGEVVAAARAAVRMLAAAELRPADLADGLPLQYWTLRRQPVPRKSGEPAPEPTPAEPSAAPAQARRKTESFRDLRPSVARMILAEMLAGALAPEDREFVATLAEQLRSAPHRCLTTAQVRRANRLWRAAGGCA